MVHIANLSVINITGDPRRPNVTVLPTAMVTLHTDKGTSPVRVLLSVETWQNFITEECLKKFDLPLLGGAPPIQVLEGQMRHILGKSNIKISAHFDMENVKTLEVLVTESILSTLPPTELHTSVKEPLVYFQLADPTFDKSAPVDILLGRRLLSDILKDEEYRIPETYCFAHDTTFGWIVLGGAPVADEPEQFLVD